MFASGVIILVYGALVLLGGIMGYAKASSRPSLVAGTVFGVLILASGWLMLSGLPVGAWMALVLALALLFLFTVRLARGASRMPAVPIIVLSVVAILASAAWLWSQRLPA